MPAGHDLPDPLQDLAIVVRVAAVAVLLLAAATVRLEYIGGPTTPLGWPA